MENRTQFGLSETSCLFVTESLSYEPDTQQHISAQVDKAPNRPISTLRSQRMPKNLTQRTKQDIELKPGQENTKSAALTTRGVTRGDIPMILSLPMSSKSERRICTQMKMIGMGDSKTSVAITQIIQENSNNTKQSAHRPADFTTTERKELTAQDLFKILRIKRASSTEKPRRMKLTQLNKTTVLMNNSGEQAENNFEAGDSNERVLQRASSCRKISRNRLSIPNSMKNKINNASFEGFQCQSRFQKIKKRYEWIFDPSKSANNDYYLSGIQAPKGRQSKMIHVHRYSESQSSDNKPFEINFKNESSMNLSQYSNRLLNHNQELTERKGTPTHKTGNKAVKAKNEPRKIHALNKRLERIVQRCSTEIEGSSVVKEQLGLFEYFAESLDWRLDGASRKIKRTLRS